MQFHLSNPIPISQCEYAHLYDFNGRDLRKQHCWVLQISLDKPESRVKAIHGSGTSSCP